MKATKFGVLYIKEKEKGEGEVIPGGGPARFRLVYRDGRADSP